MNHQHRIQENGHEYRGLAVRPTHNPPLSLLAAQNIPPILCPIKRGRMLKANRGHVSIRVCENTGAIARRPAASIGIVAQIYPSDTVADSMKEADRASATCTEGLTFLSRLGMGLRHLWTRNDFETRLGNLAGLGIAADRKSVV